MTGKATLPNPPEYHPDDQRSKVPDSSPIRDEEGEIRATTRVKWRDKGRGEGDDKEHPSTQHSRINVKCIATVPMCTTNVSVRKSRRKSWRHESLT